MWILPYKVAIYKLTLVKMMFLVYVILEPQEAEAGGRLSSR